MSKVRIREGGKTVVKIRPNDIDGYVKFDSEHANPNWTPEYREWLARQLVKRS